MHVGTAMSPVHTRQPSGSLLPDAKRQKTEDVTMSGTDTTTHVEGLLDHELHGARTFPSQTSPHFRNQPATEEKATQEEALSKSVPLQIKKLSQNAMVPTRGSAFAAGYDLYASESSIVPRRGKAMVSTGIAIAIPPGTCA